MKRFLAFFACVSLLLMQGCDPEPFLSVSPTSLSFSQDGGSQTVQVSANYPWTASVNGTGLTVSPLSGEGPATVTVTAAAAMSPSEMSGTITFRSEELSASVSVSQEAKTMILVGSTSKIPAEGGTYTVDIQYNTDFSVDVEAGAQSWIAFKGTKALTTGKLEFLFAANENTDPRTGKVTVKDKTGRVAPITLTFEQEEKKVIELGAGTITVPAAGGPIQVDVQYNTDITVDINANAQSWVTFIGTKALTSGKLEFMIAANNNTDPRSTTVTVKDKNGKASSRSLTFVQEEKKMIQADEGLRIPEEGGHFLLNVWYNVDFNVEVEPAAQSWITFIETKSLTHGEMEFCFAANDGEERTGKVYLKDKAGELSPITITFIQDKISKATLARQIMERVYEAWGAREWEKNPWIPGENWPGFWFNPQTETVELFSNEYGINREIPECIGDFGEMLSSIRISYEPGMTGTLPDSFRKLTGLKAIWFQRTGMTSIPDLFGDMNQLEHFGFNANEEMTGPLPQSLHSPVLETLYASYSLFTGEIPANWAPYASFMIVDYNCLTGKISHLFSNREDLKAFVENSNLWQKPGYGFDISDLDIPGCRNWFEDQLLENLDGTTFSIPEVVSQNKYTVYMYWALWCPFSKELMPQLKDYYDKYRQDGLEVIATIQVGDDFYPFYDYERQKKECIEKGYDKWYNFYWTKYATSYWMAVPNAEVYDQEGNVLFSSCHDYPDPVRQRFRKTASYDLIPFLETLLGPAEIPDTYESTDYSKDGQVMTLQKASVGNGVNIVFLGDGYTDKDMASGGLYETLMKQSMDEFFACEPYKSLRNRFNVYAVKAVSKNGRVGSGYTTAFASDFGSGSYIEGNNDKCYEYAMKVPGINSRDNLLVVVLANSRRHAGTTFLFSDGQTAVAYLSSSGNDPDVFGDVLRHEAGGHGFAFLADEYTQYEATAPADHIAYYNDVYDKYGWFSNVDFTDDPAKIRWSAFLADERYKNQVGIYEGAALYTLGAWRPTMNSIMRDNYGGFNAPSRWAIYQQVMKRSGEEGTFEKFLEYDAVNRTAATTAAARPPMKAAANRSIEHTAPPVIVK